MIGQTISHYRIVEKLGEGGMGVVYKADDTKLHRAVALKFLAPDKTRDEEAKKRFMREAQSASALDHPNIAVVHEIDETDDGQSFICMTYYPGQTLKERIEKGPLPLDKVNDIALQITSGLQRAHEAGIIHCDIKPANILITERGEVKIVDFGIAKLASQTVGTRSGTTGGTAAYMSPEQAQGQKIDLRSDLFSLGIVLYEMITGQRPFVGDYEPALMYSIVSVDPVRPSSLRPEIPKGIETLILKLLEKDPAKRYQNAADTRSALVQVAGVPEQRRRFPMRVARRFPKLAIAVGVLILAIGLIVLLPLGPEIQKPLRGRLPAEKSIVVLPFKNVSGDSANQVFCDGLTETLTGKITHLEAVDAALLVIPSNEVRQRKTVSPAQADSTFGVALAVTGSVERRQDRVRLTLNLVNRTMAAPLDSAQFEDQMANLLQLEEQWVAKLIELLEVKVRPQTLHAVLTSGTSNSRAYELYVQGRGYLGRSDREESISLAISSFERALKEDSLYALSYASLGEAFLRRLNLTNDIRWIHEAVRQCTKALVLNDQLASAHLTLGLIQLRTGHTNDAIMEFREALRSDSLYIDAYRALANAYLTSNDPTKAEETYKKALRLRPSYSGSHYDLGSFYYQRKLYDQAAEEYKRVIILTPDNALGYNALGATCFQQGRRVEAREMFERSIAIQPNYSVYNNIAGLLFYEGRYSDVARTYEKALEMNDKEYKVWGNLASAYYWMGDRGKAEVTYERAVEKAEQLRKVNPRDATVLSLLADYSSMLGKKTEAVRLIQDALRLEPKNLAVVKRAVDVYEQLGNREEALRFIEKALKDGTPVAEFQRGPALRQLREDARYKRILLGAQSTR